MERKNMILLTVIGAATLLVAMVGATFAFFTATVEDQRTDGDNKGKTTITAGSVANKTIVANIPSTAGKFTATGIYPGHMEVAGLSVEANNEAGDKNSVTNIAIKYDVTKNEFQEGEIKVTLYKGDNSFDQITQNETVTGNNYFQCEHKTALTTEADYEDSQKPAEGTTKFYEECQKSYDDLVSDGKLSKVGNEQYVNTSSDSITFEDTIEANSGSSKKVYYYFVLEFVNEEQSAKAEGDIAQNESMNAELEGTISVAVA